MSVAIASGPGSDSIEGAVPGQPLPTPTGAPPRFAIPVDAPFELGSAFGEARAEGRIHGGLDFHADGSATVRAACAGKVTSAGPTDTYALALTIDCGSRWAVLIGYLGAVSTRVGQVVALDAPIATLDPANPAVHFEIRWDNIPIDPAQYLDFNETPPETPEPGQTPVRPGPPATTPAVSATPGSASASPTGAGTAAATPATTVRPATATSSPTSTPTSIPTATPTPRRANPTPTLPVIVR